MTRFIVIDVPSSYNAILGRQTQGNLHIRPDVRYLTVTFATKDGDAEVFIDQGEVRKVFVKARKARDKLRTDYANEGRTRRRVKRRRNRRS